MTWILIIILQASRAGGVDHITFPDQQACEAARTQIWQASEKNAHGDLTTICVPQRSSK